MSVEIQRCLETLLAKEFGLATLQHARGSDQRDHGCYKIAIPLSDNTLSAKHNAVSDTDDALSAVFSYD